MKFTLAGLVVLLVVILTISYYVNQEGFQTLTPTSGSAVPVKAQATTAPMPPSVPGAPVLPSTPPTSVQVSDVAYDAMSKNQRAALLSDIQKVIRNEILANRSTRPVTNQDTSDDDSMDSDDDSWDEESDATAQGQDYRKNSCKKEDECATNSQCDPLVDMTKYIRKDQIPCWGCNIDY
jgi:hypothetical protein